MATGHIRKRINKDGKKSYQITVEGNADPITGKRNRKFETVKGTKKDAEARMREMMDEMDNGGIKKRTAIKLQDWLDTYITKYKINIEETTRAGYKEKCRNCINPYIGEYPISALNPDIVQELVNKLDDEKKSPKTIRNAFNILSSALEKAKIAHMISYNPCDGVELPGRKKYKAKIYDTDDIQTVLKAAEGTDMYLPILLLLSLGLRRGELCGLKWEHIDFKGRVVHICENTVLANGKIITKKPKSEAGERDIPLGKELMVALREAQRRYFKNRDSLGTAFHDHGYVFCKENGDQYRPDSITQKWCRFRTKYDLKKVKLHGLRHTNATVLTEAGVSPKIVQQRLGHSSPSITLSIYTHVTAAKDREAANTMDDLMFGGIDSGKIKARDGT